MSKTLEKAINNVLDSFLFDRLTSECIPVIISDITEYMVKNGYDPTQLHVIDNEDHITVVVDDPIIHASIRKH